MTDLFTAWSRMASAGFEMQRTWMHGLETMHASQTVIEARSDMLNASPSRCLTEMSRMVPEKVDAFSRSFAAVARDTMAMHAAWTTQMQRASHLMLSGRLPSFIEASVFVSQAADYAVGAVTATAKLGGDALAPVHRTAKGNARRLKRLKTK